MTDMSYLSGGAATHVSPPGGPQVQGQVSASVAPGAAGPASNMTIAHSILWIIGGAAAALVAIGVVFRRPIGET